MKKGLLLNRLIKPFYNTRKYDEFPQIKDVTKLLIVFNGTLGDGVMLIPMLRVLCLANPELKLDLMCGKQIETLLKKQGWVNRFWGMEKSGFTLGAGAFMKNRREIKKKIRQICKEHYEIALEPIGGFFSAYLLHMTRARRTVSYAFIGGDIFLTDPDYSNTNRRHIIENLFWLLKKMGVYAEDSMKIPSLKLSENDKILIERYKADKNIREGFWVGVHVGAGWEEKRWDKYKYLLPSLHAAYPELCFLLFSSGADEPYVREIAKEMKAAPELRYVIVHEKLSDYVRLVSMCHMMICNDSSAGHIAAAYRIPVLVLFGPVLPAIAHPYSEQSVYWISHQLECKPCNRQYCVHQNAACIKGITVEEVMDSFRELYGSLRGEDKAHRFSLGEWNG